MSNAIAVRDVSKELAELGKVRQQIAELNEQYMQLTIAGVDDRDGYKKVHEARMDVKRLRIDIEKKRKELKEESLRVGRSIDDTAKSLKSMIEPIEAYLADQQKTIDEEKDRIKREEEDRLKAEAQARVQIRIDALDEIGAMFNPVHVENMSDIEFKLFFQDMKEQAEARRQREKAEAEEKAKREAKEAARLAEERKRLEAEKAELQKLRAEQAERERLQLEEQERIEAERKQKAAEEAAKLKEERNRLAEEQQRIESQRRAMEAEKALREAKELAAKKAKQERKELAAMKPDLEKISAYLDSLEDMGLPQLKSDGLQGQLESLFSKFTGSVRDQFRLDSIKVQ